MSNEEHLNLETDIPLEPTSKAEAVREDIENDILNILPAEKRYELTSLKSGSTFVETLQQNLCEVEENEESLQPISLSSSLLENEGNQRDSKSDNTEALLSQQLPDKAIVETSKTNSRPSSTIKKIIRSSSSKKPEPKLSEDSIPESRHSKSSSLDNQKQAIRERNQRVLGTLKTRNPPALSTSAIVSPPALPESDAISDIQLGQLEERISIINGETLTNRKDIEDLKVRFCNVETLLIRLSRQIALLSNESTFKELEGSDPAASVTLGSVDTENFRSAAAAAVDERSKPLVSENALPQSTSVKMAMRFHTRRRS